MTYVTRNLGIEVEYLHPLPGVVDMNIKSEFVHSFATPATVRDVTIDSAHVGTVYVNGKQMTAIEAHEREDYEALEKLRATMELDSVIPYTIYQFAELRIRRLQSELAKVRALLAAEPVAYLRINGKDLTTVSCSPEFLPVPDGQYAVYEKRK